MKNTVGTVVDNLQWPWR